MSFKKIITLLIAFVLIVIIVIGILGYLSQRPLTIAEAEEHFKSYFEKAAKPSKDFSGIQVLIYSEKLGMNQQLAFGEASHVPDQKLDPNQPFHVASIGKLFTATLVSMFAEEGKLKFSDPVSLYLDEKELEGLFVYEGIDYQKDVTIEQLLAHTSGVADYFGDSVTSGKTIPELIISEPDTLWTPEEFLDITRQKQSAIGKPGDEYHYTDTGYILLGLVIEKLEMKPFHEVLHDRLLTPLKMNDTYMALRSEPQNQPQKPIADIWFNSVEVSRFNSISADWTGGGIISTPKDLLIFQKALHAGELISKESLDQLFNIQNKFLTGIYYGLGTMEIRFEEFFFLLKGMPRVVGHIGSLSTHLFYDTTTDTHIIMNFGSDVKMEDSFRALIDVMNTLKRVKNE